MPIVKLLASDDVTIEVDADIAKVSGLIRNVLQACKLEEGDSQEVIPITNVDSDTLELAIEWAIHHRNDYEYWDKIDLVEEVPEWDEAFFKKDKSIVVALVKAGQYLQMHGMWNFGVKTIAELMRGKRAEQIREDFDIDSDGEDQYVYDKN